MKTLYDKIEEAQELIRRGQSFLEFGIANGSLMKLANGEIRPRFCQFCKEEYDSEVKPIVRCFELNDPFVERQMMEELKSGITEMYDGRVRKIKQQLLADGYDVDSFWNKCPRIVHGKQWIVYCSNCNLTSSWMMSQDEAMAEYDHCVMEQLKWKMIYDEWNEDD